MAFDAHPNLASSSVSTAPSPPTTGTSLTVSAGEGARFDEPPPFNCTVWPAAAPAANKANAEVIRVTARVGDTFTILRAQEGTPARAIGSGDLIAASITKKTLTDVEQAFTTLDAGNLTTGTLPDARLSANVARRDQDNQFTSARQSITAANPTLRLIDTAVAAESRVFEVVNVATVLQMRAMNDAGSAATAYPLTLARSGDATIGRDIFEKARTVPIGHWTPVPFNAANFTASSGTFDVAAGNVSTHAYTVVGKTLVMTFYGFNFGITGSPTELRIAHPAGFTYAATLQGQPMAWFNGGTGTGWSYSTATHLVLARDLLVTTPWAAGACHLAGTFWIPLA